MAINYAANKRYFGSSALMGADATLAIAGVITVLSSQPMVGLAMIILGIGLCIWDKKIRQLLNKSTNNAKKKWQISRIGHYKS